jgi:hypothetical protein
MVFELARIHVSLTWKNMDAHGWVPRQNIAHTKALQENFDKRDNLEREKVSKRDKFPCYLT